MTNQSNNLNLIPLSKLDEVAHIFHLISTPLRIRILDFLDRSGQPQRVTEIVENSGSANQPLVSQQLRILKEGGLLASERDKNQVFYRIISPEVRRYLAFMRNSSF